MLIHYVYSLLNYEYHIKVRSSCIQFSSLPFYIKKMILDIILVSMLSYLLVHIRGPWFDPFKAMSSIIFGDLGLILSKLCLVSIIGNTELVLDAAASDL